MTPTRMGNSLDPDGRGPSERHLLGAGLVVLLAIAVVTAGLLAKSTGRLNAYVRVIADLNNVGDGLPAQSDVKYHGLLVGTVKDLIPAAHGNPNYVHIDLKPEYAKNIPATVTARVVPSNVFAVSSIQLVDRGGIQPGPPIRNGTHVVEDDELSTVIFQTTISKLRDILGATGRDREDQTIGILAAVNAATENRRGKLLAAGADMTRILDQLNAVVATDPGPSTTSALLDAARGLKSTAPELIDALGDAVRPMQTFAEKRAELTSLVAGAQDTLGVAREAFDNQTDRLIEITHNITPVIGVFAIHADKFVPIFHRLNKVSRNFFSDLYHPDLITNNMRVNLSWTPMFTYTRADCPRYGDLAGPSCYTAPEVSVRPKLPDEMLPQIYNPPAGLPTPPGTELGPNGKLIAVGPPMTQPDIDLYHPGWDQPLPWWTGPAPRVPTTADPDGDPPPPPSPPKPAGPQGPDAQDYWQHPAGPASFSARHGGNVGPVGSQAERNQLGVITAGLTGEHRPASVATQLLVGPVARGTAVSMVPANPTKPGASTDSGGPR